MPQLTRLRPLWRAQAPQQRSRAALLLGGLLTGTLLLVSSPALPFLEPAFAGNWTEVTCNQPDGQGGFKPALTDGWSAGPVLAPGGYTGTTNTCPNGGADASLTAFSSGVAAQNVASGAQWQWTAPPGSTIAGGYVSAAFHSPRGVAALFAPALVYDAANVFGNCQYTEPCANGHAAAHYPLNGHTGGTTIWAQAVCGVPMMATCPGGGSGADDNASVKIYAGVIQLANSSVPAGSNFSGPLLAPNAQGVADLLFSASDPGGPGVLKVTVQIDGRSIYDAIPDANGGACNPIGTDASGFLEFVHGQPCKQAEMVDAPVDTSTVAGGPHALRVLLTDAAQNQSVVLAQQVTIGKPSVPPPPNHCSSSKPQKPRLSLHVRPVGHGRLRFTGTLRGPIGCPLGTANTRPLVIIEVKNGRHWQAVGVTARVSRSGSYRATYRGGHGGSIGGRFSFRAVAPSTPSFVRATSRVRRARVR